MRWHDSSVGHDRFPTSEPVESGVQICREVSRMAARNKPAAKAAAKKAPATKSAATSTSAVRKSSASGTRAPAKKSPAKKAAAKKAPATKTVTKKAPVGKTAAKKAPAKKTATKKAAAKTTAAKKAPAKKTAAEKTATKKAAVTKTAAKKAPAEQPAAKQTTKQTSAPTRSTTTSSPKRESTKSTAAKATEEASAVHDLPKPRFNKDGFGYTKDFDLAFVKEMYDLLQEERVALTGQAKRLEDEAHQLVEEAEMGDVQFDDEGGEGDTMVVERERDLALSAQARETVAEIDAAIERIMTGSYGYSTVSGQPIPRERLEAIPWSSVLVEEKVGGIGRR
jgi:RNA polymerase-binding transcription factor DksA